MSKNSYEDIFKLLDIIYMLSPQLDSLRIMELIEEISGHFKERANEFYILEDNNKKMKADLYNIYKLLDFSWDYTKENSNQAYYIASKYKED